MIAAAVAVVVVTIIVFGVAQVVRECWVEVPGLEERSGVAGFNRWAWKALIVPIAVWTGWNLIAFAGPPWGWAPLTPRLGSSIPVNFLVSVAVWGFWTMVMWAGFTFAWLLPDIARQIRRRDEFSALATAVGVGAALLLAGALWLRSWTSVCLILAAALGLLVRWSISLIHKPSVSYARAIARVKRGRYDEAEQEVIQQLEEKADDYEGWMMLAQLYAEQFGQVAEAEQTVRELCDQPGINPLQVSLALTRLAEWHLKLANNPPAAQAALEEIILRCPDTTFARTAENRIRQLPRDEAELQEQRQPKRIRLPALRETAPGEANAKASPVELSDARTEAATLRARLEIRPDDWRTRLRLAQALAERLGQLDLAVSELEKIRQSEEFTKELDAELLALEAAWRLSRSKDSPRARELLEQLVTRYPKTPQALAARRQIDLIDHPEMHRIEPPPPPPPPKIVVRLPSAAAGPHPTRLDEPAT